MPDQQAGKGDTKAASEPSFSVVAPQIDMPKGGGAIRGMGEKFAANPVTGTASMNIPIATSPGRSGFGPQLSVAYDSGVGNGPFGFGWNLALPMITRRTDRGLPKYEDATESDVFILSGAEDLVPVLIQDIYGEWKPEQLPPRALGSEVYSIQRYRPRIEGLFARIERWTNEADAKDIFWRTISKDNVTTIYGKYDEARIADPADQTHIFAWHICESYDDKGNAIVYRYKSEDAVNIDPIAPYERSRLITNQFAQRYLKHIRYGNRTPRQSGEDLTLRNDWMFEVIFDYGEHDQAIPTTQELSDWPVRQDPFSLFRATFEVRTYRLCRRVLMFHHFPDELGGTVDYLVQSTDFEYKEGTIASFIASAAHAGYVQQPDSSYLKKSLPKLEFKYTEARVDETVHDIDAESVQHLPIGVDGSRYEWVDLDSEGLTGVLTEQADAWYYKRNLGNGTFGPREMVVPRPSPAALSSGQQQLLDLAGEGRLNLVQFDGPMAGFHERTAAGGWEPFTRFKSLPHVNTKDPNLRFVDITGDGHADILISEETVFTWYESNAKQGFAPARRAAKSWDEEKGPKLVFAESTQTIFLADMSGDGLADIVRVRYDEVCYWPNLGYGRFGAKVAMGNVPLFDSPDQFDPKRIRLADIDGSGSTDIIYIGRQGISLYFNQSGNAWSTPQLLAHYPRTDSLRTISIADLLGNGTACLVWSSSLGSDLRQPMRYIDLMGGQKPHLLINSTNNMGAETEIQYAASTRFYLQDRLEGRPWATKLPFPVHVVERVESRDMVSNTRLVSTYRYRHGYFDGVEREFRGFAYVEQRDVESVVGQFDLPPVVSKTWFHTGALLDGDKLEAYFKNPDNQEYFTGDVQAIFLPDTSLPPNLSVDEMREAARALKGSILRQEVYAEDGSAQTALPYSVSERSYTLARLQVQGPNRHAVFFSHPNEAIDYHYERNPVDPRISHALTLAVDAYGNVLKSATIGYPRRVPAYDEQGKVLATLSENQVTVAIFEDDAYRAPLSAGSKTYELTAPTLQGAQPLDFAEIDAIAAAASEITYEVPPTLGLSQKRLLSEARTLYRKGDLSALLPLGIIDSMALPGESYKKALTPGLFSVFQDKASPAELTSLLTGSEGRYRDLDGDGALWISSGQVFYSPDPLDSAQQELTFASAHFFLPHRFQEPFGANSIVSYDTNALLLVSVVDAIGNQVLSDHDYRVLQPKLITDPNGNRSEARFDALGMLTGTAIQGKATGPLEGDSFDDFAVDLSSLQTKDFFDSANPRQLAVAYLGSATTRIVYDLDHIPVCAAAIARETHISDLAAGQVSEVQLHFVYSDGFGREAQTKVQAEPGPLDLADPQSPLVDPRWVGTGAKVYNNKGKPVRQFEPFFSATPGFGIEQHGVSSTLFYDPMQRVVATLHPNHSFEKIVFDPWRQETWDVNDTVTKADPKLDPDVGGFFQALPDSDYLPTWHEQRKNGQLGPDEKDAATKAAAHANTPSIAHLDTLGRPILTIADNGKDNNNVPQQYTTQVTLNIEGKQLAVTDALVRKVMTYDYDMLGSTLHQASMEAGARWMLNDATGKPLRAWDSRGHTHRTEYDVLHRPLNSFVIGADLANPAREICFEQTIYSEASGLTAAQVLQANLRGKPYQHLDTAGLVTSETYDFKGNLLRSTRQLVQDYKTSPDWSQNPQPILEAEVFTSSTRFDALNRPIQMLAPHMTNGKMNVMRPGYNAANLLERVDVWLAQDTKPSTLLAPASANLHAVTNIDYDAKGQRARVAYGNGAQTAYSYDPQTLRLMHLQTSRSGAPVQQSLLQDLFYYYDPVGNVTHIRDAAQQPIYFNNQVVLPECDYAYDPIYRLINASGREHIGQLAQPQTSWSDEYRVNLPQPGDGQAMRSYTEHYLYDAVGNFEKLIHQAANGTWNRSYAYNEASLNEAAKNSNRLSSTSVLGVSEPYAYDAHGNMTSMPHLTLMQWDFKDQLSVSSRQVVNLLPPPNKVAETTFYVYDGGGERIRKVTERQNGSRKNERIYLGGFEVFREFKANGSDIELERETLHVMDNKQRIALVETLTHGDDGSPAQLIRYQLGNHLGSISLELDDQANVISYEEYFPYGSTSYQAVEQSIKTAVKRYRYTGKERDEETGFSYHGARYYTEWLGRWVSCDPAGISASSNLYAYVAGKPITHVDITGLAEEEPGFFSRHLGPASPLGQYLSHADYVGSSFLQDDKKLQIAQAAASGVAVAAAFTAIAIVAAPAAIATAAKGASVVASSAAIATGASGVTATAVATTAATATSLTLKVGLASYGAYQTVNQGREVVTGRDLQTHEKLSDPQRAFQIGGLVVGAIAFAYGSFRVMKGPLTSKVTSTPKGPYPPNNLTNIRVTPVDGGGFKIHADQGHIQARFDSDTGNLAVDKVHAYTKGYGTPLYRAAIAKVGGLVSSISGFLAEDNAKAIRANGGDYTKAPSVKIRAKLGFTEHRFNAKSGRLISTNPNIPKQ